MFTHSDISVKLFILVRVSVKLKPMSRNTGSKAESNHKWYSAQHMLILILTLEKIQHSQCTYWHCWEMENWRAKENSDRTAQKLHTNSNLSLGMTLREPWSCAVAFLPTVPPSCPQPITIKEKMLVLLMSECVYRPEIETERKTVQLPQHSLNICITHSHIFRGRDPFVPPWKKEYIMCVYCTCTLYPVSIIHPVHFNLVDLFA